MQLIELLQFFVCVWLVCFSSALGSSDLTEPWEWLEYVGSCWIPAQALRETPREGVSWDSQFQPILTYLLPQGHRSGANKCYSCLSWYWILKEGGKKQYQLCNFRCTNVIALRYLASFQSKWQPVKGKRTGPFVGIFGNKDICIFSLESLRRGDH